MTAYDDDQPKYIVFKLEEWNRWEASWDWKGGRPTEQHPAPLDDAVVIRLKDPFAATALDTYAHTILNGIENWGDFWPAKECARMLEIADYFHNQAMESQKIKGKRLPD
jgi:hypothetical protein